MPEHTFVVPGYFDYTATLMWAISGALLAARRGYAILGVGTVALVSSTGGGLLRDILLQDVPAVLQSPIYLEIGGVAVLFVLFASVPLSRWRNFGHVMTLIDAIGFGAYAVVGMTKALTAGLPVPSVIVVGMVNAVGGGVLRDVLMAQKVNLFQPGTVEQANALIGCFLFVIMLHWLHFDVLVCAWTTIACVFALRILAITFDIKTSPMLIYKVEQR